MWAVPELPNQQTNAARRAKASKVGVGSLGILYCSVDKSFTSPFVVHSKPELDRVVEHVWDGRWILPFGIRSLGNPHARLPWEEAKRALPSCKAGKPLHSLIHVQPLTVFAGSEVEWADWQVLIERLAN
jgi:hypothetical protein